MEPSNGTAPDGTKAQPDAPMEPPRKRRTAPAGQLELIRAAINAVEIALIFDTSDGKKGAYGGLGDTNARTRDSVERTISSIITATLPGVQFEQCRVDHISVYKEPSFFIILLVTQAIADATLGATNSVIKLIDYTIAGATPEDQGKPRTGVSIVVTTPSQIPLLAMFGGRTDTSIPAGELAPGIQVVMYLTDTRELRVSDASMRTWAMEELMKDIDHVLTDERQPLSGYRTQVIPGQPTRLNPKTPGGVAIGISIKFWLIAPIDPRNTASILGVLLPAPIILPLKIVEDPASPTHDPEFINVWTNNPDDPKRVMTRMERCQGGKNNAGDGVSVRYVVNNVRGTIMQARDGEQLWRAGDDADEELDATQGLTPILTDVRNAHRIQMRINAVKAQAAKVDKECMQAHKLAQATIYFSTGVCDEAIKRLSTRDSPTFVPADRAMDFASMPEIPSELLNAACRSANCKKNMCISLNMIAEAVLAARIEGRARQAAILETTRLNEEISSVMPLQSVDDDLVRGFHPPPWMESQAPKPLYAAKGGTSTTPRAPTARPPAPVARPTHPKAPIRHVDEERRYEVGGSEAYTKSEFHKFYGDDSNWDKAGPAPPNSRAARDYAAYLAKQALPTPPTFGFGAWRNAHPSNPTTMPAPLPTLAPRLNPATSTTVATPSQKAARSKLTDSPSRLTGAARPTMLVDSPGRVLSEATHALGINEYGSAAPAAPIVHGDDATMAEVEPKVHGWNCPMPLEGEAHLGVRIPISLSPAVRKLAQGLASLQAPYDASGGYIPSSSIAAYMAQLCPTYGTFDADQTEELIDALDNANVISIHRCDDDAPTEYLALFLIEPTLAP